MRRLQARLLLESITVGMLDYELPGEYDEHQLMCLWWCVMHPVCIALRASTIEGRETSCQRLVTCAQRRAPVGPFGRGRYARHARDAFAYSTAGRRCMGQGRRRTTTTWPDKYFRDG